MEWSECKNLLCVRLDNMGDLLMSSPAIASLKKSFHCRITVLTSPMAKNIAALVPCIDDIIVYDSPWVKSGNEDESASFFAIIEKLRSYHFDAAVIFTTFSQNPLPAVLLAYLAGIPKRIAYCRENPYKLLTDWIPEKEPYSFIRHQVQRDLALVKSIGANVQEKKLQLKIKKDLWPGIIKKLEALHVSLHKPWLILHAGVSEPKREYPPELWIETGKRMVKELNYQVILTGNQSEKEKLGRLKESIGENACNTAGLLTLEEFIVLINYAPLVISVNTGTVHIAAATETPVIVLYALSNPQHLPWMARGKCLPYNIPEELKSKNEVLQYVYENRQPKDLPVVMPENIILAAREILNGNSSFIPQLVSLQNSEQVF